MFAASLMQFSLILQVSAAHHANLYFFYQSEAITMICVHSINPTTHIMQERYILFKEREKIPHTGDTESLYMYD